MDMESTKGKLTSFFSSLELVHLVLKDSFIFACIAVIFTLLATFLNWLSQFQATNQFADKIIINNMTLPPTQEIMHLASYVGTIGVFVVYCLVFILDLLKFIVKRIVETFSPLKTLQE